MQVQPWGQALPSDNKGHVTYNSIRVSADPAPVVNLTVCTDHNAHSLIWRFCYNYSSHDLHKGAMSTSQACLEGATVQLMPDINQFGVHLKVIPLQEIAIYCKQHTHSWQDASRQHY